MDEAFSGSFASSATEFVSAGDGYHVSSSTEILSVDRTGSYAEVSHPGLPESISGDVHPGFSGNDGVCSEDADRMEPTQDITTSYCDSRGPSASSGANNEETQIRYILSAPIKGEKRPYNMANRSTRKRVQCKRAVRKLRLDSLQSVRGMLCCAKKCCANLTAEDVKPVRDGFYAKTFEARKRWWLQTMQDFTVMEHDTERTRPVVCSRKMCILAYCNVLGISATTFYNHKRHHREGVVHLEHGRTGLRRPSKKVVDMLARMTKFIDEHADDMPNDVATRASACRPRRRIPAAFTKRSIYESIRSDLDAAEQEVVSESTFYAIWNKYFWHVSLAESNTFTKCALCNYYKQCIAKVKYERDRAKFKLKMKEHQERQVNHRQDYSRAKLDSILRPSEHLCLIIDGMDQKKTTLPHIGQTNYSKDLQHDRMMRTTLTAVIAHGRDPSIYVYTYFPYFKHNASSTATCLMRTLQELQASGESLPPRLRIQADNCWKENKNQFICGLAALLVKFGIFEEIEIGFMIVGHTHTDVDATFSVFSKKLKDNDAYTMDELFALIEQSHKKPPKCIFLDNIPDWKGKVAPFLASDITGISKPHLLKFYMVADNPVMVYKEHCDDPDWLPEDGPLYWFKRDEVGRYDGPVQPFDPFPSQPTESDYYRNGCEGVDRFLQLFRARRDTWSAFTDKEVARIENAFSYWERVKEHGAFIIKNGVAKIPVQNWWPSALPLQEVQSRKSNSEETRREPLFVGHRKDRPKTSFDPLVDIEKDSFLIIQPPDEELHNGVPFWVGQALTPVVLDKTSVYYKHVKVAYWIPTSKSRSLAERYNNAWGKRWKLSDEDTEQWQVADSVAFAWKRSAKGKASNKPFTSGLTIPQRVCKSALVALVGDTGADRGDCLSEDESEEDGQSAS